MTVARNTSCPGDPVTYNLISYKLDPWKCIVCGVAFGDNSETSIGAMYRQQDLLPGMRENP